ncbi:SPBc2 prophage-derived glycosyltransferase SunS [Gimesia maris]|uniref:glycosyltransferase n=1 Tax=Gimesia maris TaxID=122 RepID=UPI00118D248A|nr:glycosyltransferase [Gimesia maris]QDT76779.1 SPBc2 prophage-derived glycosyltransferase SunS [Gimesia maris]
MQRVAVIFDNTLRPETTGTYCRRALGELVQAGKIATVEHFLPTELAHVSQDQFDLFLYIDDGLDWSIPDHLRPAAWWAIDTHLNFERCLQKAVQADFTFAAQRDGAARLKKAGIQTAIWLPLACDPEIHAQQELPKEYDVSFVGHVVSGIRQELLALLQHEFPNSFIGQEYYEKMAAIYSQSKVVFNRSILNDVNMRVFEGLCSGSLLITNDLTSNGQEELFQAGIHCVVYQNAEELIEKLHYYLEHDDIREQIAQAGRTRVLEAHTYQHRMERILSKCQQPSEATSIPEGKPAKASYYFEFDRPDVLALVPDNAQSVLDIGCGGGRLGAALKQRQNATVWGVEFDPTVADRARNHLDQVFAGDITADEISFVENQFDCIICADVLEHLREPEKALKRIRHWLRPDGCLVTSIPNVRNHTVIRSLLAGNWTYEVAGLLDEDHVRFFTRSDIEKMLFRTGFTIEEMKLVGGEGFEEWIEQGQPATLSLGPMQFQTSSREEAVDLFAYQYLNRSNLQSTPAYGTTSIILVTHNQLAYTQICIESIFKRTIAPFELIVVDNGSTDGTTEYLSSLDRVRVIENEENRGFPAAANQGIEIATGDAVLLLNNDTIVTTGWLDSLRTTLRSDEKIGIVGPLTNCTAGPQRIPTKYTLESLDDFAWSRRVANQYRCELVSDITGFCMLIDRKILESVGGFDEQFEIGLYEDIDFCKRVRDAGYQLAIAQDAFVHHFGHKSFQVAGIVQDELALRNEENFCQKWELKKPFELKDDVSPTPFQYHSPRALNWKDDLKSLRKTLELFSEQHQKVLVFSYDDSDLFFCKELQASLGCDLTICNTNESEIGEFKSITLAELEIQSDVFDAVVCRGFDQYREPRQLLGLIHQSLTPGGELFVSIPNLRSATTIRSLCSGTWPTEIWDPALRFFTRREMEKLLCSENFTFSSWSPMYLSEHGEWVAQGRSHNLNLESFAFQTDNPYEIEEILTDEFVVAARKSPLRDYGLTSIIVVTHNQLRYTRNCLDSLKMRTSVPFEITVVDNGSQDGTVEYINSLPDVKLISNRDNKGFPAAVNQGLKVANGKNILLLNNDTIVTTCWLQRMLKTLYSHDRVGLVGPVTNHISGPQQIEVSYQHLNELDGFAWDLGRTLNGQSISTDRLVGYCLLFKREIVDQIGLFDERFGIGNFEDDDFCRRAIQAGYNLLIAKDAFVHHFGSITFRGRGIDFNQLLQQNQKLYQQKWETNSSPDDLLNEDKIREKPQFLFDETEEGAFILKPNPLKLSACLIVRDNERTIGPCLESLAPWVDEIVVVDTGSVDRTPEICKENGAHVYYWAWRDDFSAARNESFKYAQGEWIFWMDSDDTLPPECGQRLRDLVKEDIDSKTLGFVGQVHCPNKNSTDVTVVDHVKLIRNRSDLRFEFRIHEQILPSIRRAGGSVEWSDIYVVHSGSDQSVEGRKRKLERDYRLLELDHRERPQHPFVLFNLGMTYADDQKYETAAQYLKECIEVAEPEESQVRKAYALLTNALAQFSQYEEAWKYCIQGLEHYPSDKELLFRQAMLHHHFGRLHDAEATYLRVLNETEERHFVSIDVGLCGYKSRHNLALVYEDLGDLDRAEEQWRSIIEMDPGNNSAWRGLGELLLKSEKVKELEQLLSEMSGQEALQIDGCIFKARVHELQGDHQSAIQILQNHLDHNEDNREVLQELCRIAFKHSTRLESLKLLTILAEKTPVDASVYHNLGTCYLQLKEHEHAISAYRRSLDLRSHSPETWHLLGHAYFNLGDSQNAQSAWHEVLNLSPGHAEASRLLNSLFEDTLV